MLKCRFQSTAASVVTVSGSARRMWKVEPRGPVHIVAGCFVTHVRQRLATRGISSILRATPGFFLRPNRRSNRFSLA